MSRTKNTGKLVPWIIVAAGVAAHLNCLPNPFVFDDSLYIVENPHIRSLWPPWASLAHSTRPVVNLSFAVNYAVGGTKPFGYHVVNVAIHLLAGLLLYGIVRRSLETQRFKWKRARSAAWLGGLVALLWVVHPLQTESVTYTWQRCESLMGLFYLLTLYCVIRSHDSPRANWWATGAVVSCALGMASKEVMVTAPVVVLLYDRAFLAASWKDVWRRRWPLYAGVAATWLVLGTLLLRGLQSSDVYAPTADITYREIGRWPYLLTQAGAILHYLWLSVWPTSLCLDYGWAWPVANSISDVWPGLMVVGGLILLTVWAWWRWPPWGFFGVWFFLILAPTSSVVPIQDVVFEHRMYLPLAAVIGLGVIGGVTLLDRLPDAWRRWEWGGTAVALVVAVTLTALTIRRNENYRSGVSIWQDTVMKMPQSARAHNNLGRALLDTGRPQDATAHLQEALRIKPDLFEAHNNLGNALNNLGHPQDAIPHLQEALRINPDYAKAHNNLGNALNDLGRPQEAIPHIQEALRIKPDLAEAHYNLGDALHYLGRPQEAIPQYQEALRIKPDYAEAHNNLGYVLNILSRPQEAIHHFQEALRIKPDLAEAHFNLGNALNITGRPQEAVPHYQEALRIKPDYAEAHNNLGYALNILSRPREAIHHFQEALRIKPDYDAARVSLRQAEQELLHQDAGSANP